MGTNAKYCPEIKCRWNSYNTYRFVLWAWMMNEISVASAPVKMSHTAFYIHSVLFIFSAIFVGIPLVYSEICVSQYTNGNVISVWNFCPIFCGVGYGAVYLIILKLILLMVLSTWYLKYTFYSAMDPPPWFTCDDYNNTKCMVKRVNVSIFQHCLEAQNLFRTDCGMKTASSYFFEKEIGNNNTKNKNCTHLWGAILASAISSATLFIVLIKKEKFFKINVRVAASYLCIVLFLLFCVALSTSGTWYATKIGINRFEIQYNNCFYTSTQGILACGVGCGIIGYLSRDVSFRSPATMTAVTVPLFSTFITLMLALIIFSGIKTVSYYHGEEENVLEVGDSIYFNLFASVSEILGYFDGMPIWSFAFFSTAFICLLVNMSILYLFLLEYLSSTWQVVKKYKHFSYFCLIFSIFVFSFPFYCSDLTVVLSDVTEIIQLTSAFFFSVATYWIYGFRKHNVDIIFMIGVKASYFWKIAWLTIPIWMLLIIYKRCTKLLVKQHENSLFIEPLSINVDELMVYAFLVIYFFIVLLGALIQVKRYYYHDSLKNLFRPVRYWGPQDKILFRSRNMFVPEIMTREFLYRQVKIRGYTRKTETNENRRNYSNVMQDMMLPENTEWSALTSN
ncbi:sodium-dependent noradrenaline transporter-like [Maniola hyperantus]|uniref:sodium-dependent noradrenaline transporter-like n=1 Tax=Aphantopus hyperantus TaxID=2795564 RepID=UPI0015686855|nr:sodium-dependent noradrenaline transporter-like [Maniola hyperantus]